MAQSYSIDKWLPSYELHDFNIDYRHAYWLYEVLASANFKVVAEIGCFNGFSSTAFLEALSRGFIKELHLCDTSLHPMVRHWSAYFPNLYLHQMDSLTLFEHFLPIEFLFLDGDHTLENVTQESKAIRQQSIPTIMAHDTNSDAAGLAGCEGPAYLKRDIQRDERYFVLEDNLKRPGERTERGMLFASRLPEVFAIGRNAYSKICG